MTVYKELKELWSWLDFCVWVGNWRKASETCDRIDKLKQRHKIANFFARLFYVW